MKRAAPAILLLAALAGCATLSPEAKVRHALVKAGVQPPVAQCMAEKMARKLSIAQLERLKSVAEMPGEEVGHMSVKEVLHRVRALGDPEIVTVTTRAAIGCEIADG